MCEAGALGFIQSAPVPLRALYDRNMMDDPNTDFDNLPEVPEIKLDEHQYAVIKQMVKERQTFELEFDIRNHFKLGPIKYHNVIASIKGYDLSYDEIWHTERDLYNKNIPEYQEHTATVTAIVALGVANLDKQLSREGLYIKE